MKIEREYGLKITPHMAVAIREYVRTCEKFDESTKEILIKSIKQPTIEMLLDLTLSITPDERVIELRETREDGEYVYHTLIYYMKTNLVTEA